MPHGLCPWLAAAVPAVVLCAPVPGVLWLGHDDARTLGVRVRRARHAALAAAVKQLAAEGFPITDELLARLSPLQYDHTDFRARYAFTRPAVPGLRQLRDPHTDDEDDGGEQD
ncbi:hypothetical protein [Streptomyces fradiae]|uniref:hypothetical protein n=1 Tax=Streptomyces fradiae TaxID=1906 RepID=UPI0035BE95C1